MSMSCHSVFCFREESVKLSFKTTQFYFSPSTMIPTVNKCCACMSLKTGTIIIGVLHLVRFMFYLGSLCAPAKQIYGAVSITQPPPFSKFIYI